MDRVKRQPADEKEFFRQVMARFTTGITVVTTSHLGEVRGMTVNAFCSVSLQPPLVLICIQRSSSMLPLLRASKVFAINILTEKQEDLARGFASSSEEREHFCSASYRFAATHAPILEGGLAFIDTRVVAEYPGGDHVIFLGEVLALGTSDRVMSRGGQQGRNDPQEPEEKAQSEEEKDPLIYYLGEYRTLSYLPHGLSIHAE